jgi:hypothetical protein
MVRFSFARNCPDFRAGILRHRVCALRVGVDKLPKRPCTLRSSADKVPRRADMVSAVELEDVTACVA